MTTGTRLPKPLGRRLLRILLWIGAMLLAIVIGLAVWLAPMLFPQIQPATIRIADPAHPATAGLPIIWTHCVGRGHAVYSALEHAAESYAEPLVRRSPGNAMAWAAREPACRDGR